jgi:hypothetical protein
MKEEQGFEGLDGTSQRGFARIICAQHDVAARCVASQPTTASCTDGDVLSTRLEATASLVGSGPFGISRSAGELYLSALLGRLDPRYGRHIADVLDMKVGLVACQAAANEAFWGLDLWSRNVSAQVTTAR